MPDENLNPMQSIGILSTISFLPTLTVARPREVVLARASPRPAILGIDFGSYACAAARLEGDAAIPQAIPDADGLLRTPSVVFFAADETLVGAIAQQIAEAADSDDAALCFDDVKTRLVKDEPIGLGDRKVTPVEIASELLRAIGRIAQVDGAPVARTGVAYPVTFTPVELAQLRNAAVAADLGEIDLVEEPVATVLAFDRCERDAGDMVLVLDAGASKFSASVLLRDDRGSFRPLAKPRTHPIGGDGFDRLLLEHLEAKLRQTDAGGLRENGAPPSAAILAVCRRCKEELSIRQRSRPTFRLPNDKSVELEVTRSEFEKLILFHAGAIARIAKAAYEDATSMGHPVDTVLLLGGSARIPLLTRLITESLPKAPARFAGAQSAIALGAAIAAAIADPLLGRGVVARVRVEQTTTLSNLAHRVERMLEQEKAQMLEDEQRRRVEVQKQVLNVFQSRFAAIEANRQLLRKEVAHQLANRQFADARQTICALLKLKPDDGEVLKVQQALDSRHPKIGEVATLNLGVSVNSLANVGGIPDVTCLVGTATGRLTCNLTSCKVESQWGTISTGYGCRGLFFDREKAEIYTGGDNGPVQVWSSADLAKITESTSWATGALVFRILPLRQRRQLITAGSDGKLKIWDQFEKRLLNTFEGLGTNIRGLDACHDERLLVSGGDDGMLRLWDLNTSRQFRILGTHRGGVFGARFLPKSDRVVISCGNDSAIRLWDAKTGQAAGVWEGHESGVHAIHFTPDGRYLVSASLDKTVRVWDVASGWEVRKFTGHSNEVYAVIVTDDGKHAISGGADNTIRLWNLGLP